MQVIMEIIIIIIISERQKTKNKTTNKQKDRNFSWADCCILLRAVIWFPMRREYPWNILALKSIHYPQTSKYTLPTDFKVYTTHRLQSIHYPQTSKYTLPTDFKVYTTHRLQSIHYPQTSKYTLPTYFKHPFVFLYRLSNTIQDESKKTSHSLRWLKEWSKSWIDSVKW